MSDWAWLGPMLLRSITQCPSTLLPQIVILSNAFHTRQREVIAYQFNEELLEAWFGQKTIEFWWFRTLTLNLCHRLNRMRLDTFAPQKKKQHGCSLERRLRQRS